MSITKNAPAYTVVFQIRGDRAYIMVTFSDSTVAGSGSSAYNAAINHRPIEGQASVAIGGGTPTTSYVIIPPDAFDAMMVTYAEEEITIGGDANCGETEAEAPYFPNPGGGGGDINY